MRLAPSLALVLLLAACSVPPASHDQPTHTASRATPKCRSTDDAVAAAETLYRRYLQGTDAVSAAGGADTDQLSRYVTDHQLEEEKKGAGYSRAHDLKIKGATRLLKFAVQRVDLAKARLTAYACIGFREARVVHSSDRDVTPASRVDHQTSEAVFEWSSGVLKLDGNIGWSGKSIC